MEIDRLNLEGYLGSWEKDMALVAVGAGRSGVKGLPPQLGASVVRVGGNLVFAERQFAGKPED